MNEAIGIALFLTIVVAAITGATFWQGVGIFAVMFIVAFAYVIKIYENK